MLLLIALTNKILKCTSNWKMSYTSITWTQTLDSDPGLGSWTQTLDPRPGPWTWTLKNLE